MEKFHTRKPNRLKNYDYSWVGAYFITVCSKDKRCIFWENVGASTARPEDVKLSRIGEVVDGAIREIPQRYNTVSIENYVVMPNHLHILMRINADEEGRAMLAPTVSHVMQQMKGAVTKKLGDSLWQKGFYEHVVRDENDFLAIWEYIENNPLKWLDDEYCD